MSTLSETQEKGRGGKPKAEARSTLAPSQTAKALPGDRQAVAVGCLLAFALLWLIELFVVQQWTLNTTHSGGPQFDYWAPKIRFALDVLFVASAVSILRVRWLACVAVFSLLLNIALVTYANYFQRPLTMSTLLTVYREGAAVSRYAADWIPQWPTAVLLAICAVKLSLLWQARTWQISRKVRCAAFVVPASAFVALYLVTLWLDPLNAIVGRRGVARLGVIRGYTGPWLAELYYTWDPRLTQLAIARASDRTDRLTPEEATIPIHDRLVIIQVESLDFNVLGHRVDGREVTPFLNGLRDAGLFYRARPYHVIGSADADFTMLMGGPPAKNVLNYSLPDFPYDNSLPRFLRQHGFESISFHGNSGTFYSRRQAFEKMRFSKIYFREELEPLGAFTPDAMGLRDADVLAFAAHQLRAAKGPICQFIITLTSHTPYRFIPPDSTSPVPTPRDAVDRYFNHIHYTDACLRDFIVSLGKGVTVLIYADHPTEVERADFQPAHDATAKYVPVFVYDTDQNLAKLQQTRSGLALDGKLTMVDISSFLRNQIAHSWPALKKKPTTSDR